MAVSKPMEPFDLELEDNPDVSALDVEIVNPDAVTITPDDDGTIVIDFDGGITEKLVGPEHNDNLADFMDDSDLEAIGSELVESFMADRNSRKDWADAYVRGLDLLGFKIEDRTIPWQGASGVFHPVLTEAVVRFQAQAMSEIMPASGPVKSKIMGKLTKEKFEQSTRVQNEMNYIITERMVEYRDEMEQMFFRLSIAGSTFKKTYYDPLKRRPVSIFVPAEDFVISYGASNIESSERYTHVMKKTRNEVRKLQAKGFYRGVDLPEPSPERSDIQEKYDELDGTSVSFNDDDRHTLLEMHVDYDMPEPFNDPDGIARPYVVTIDLSSRTILSIRRNWYEDDEEKEKRNHFVHYPYLPGLGFYGTGLVHLIGGLAKSATSILRQLIDAGTLSNLPAGLKARGLRIKGDNTPLMPGEFRDVDVPGGAIRDSIFPLPFKEPSSVLYSLLGNIVEEARRIGSVADVQVGDINAQAPVGTTLALMERSMKVMSGVQARMHAAMKKELRILARIIHDYMPETYDYELNGDFNRVEDFDMKIVDVIPVSDPNSATMAQRIMQYQAALQLAQQAPQLYDMGKLHRQMLEVLGIQDADDIIKLPEDIKPKDPVAENMAILKQEPVKAFLYQDHEAHIAVHMAAIQDPKIQQIVGQSPFAAAIQQAMAAHITEHVAMQYRKEIEKQMGVPLPPEGEQLPEDIEADLSRVVQQAAAKLLAKDQQEVAAAQAQQQAQNPLTQMQMKELELREREVVIKEAEAQHQMQLDKAKMELDLANKAANIEVQRERIGAENERASAQAQVQLAKEVISTGSAERIQGARLGAEIGKNITDRLTTPRGEQ
jgi:hypothetical protein